MKKILYGFVGLAFMAATASAANIPYLNGPIDPSGLLGTFNQLIASINSGIQSKLYGNGVAAATTAVTTEETLFTYSLPANYLANAGDAVRVECSAATGATANNKTLRLYFGSAVVSTGAVAANAQNLYLNYTVTRGASASAQAFAAGGVGGTNSATLVAQVNTAATEDLTAAVTIRCTGQNGTAAAGDISAKSMIVEAIK